MASSRHTTWVVLLRALNVGTANRITMRRLTEVVEHAGCSEIRTHLQSGNLVLRTATGDRERVATSIEAMLIDAGMKKVDAMVRTTDELTELLERRPFDGVDPETHHRAVVFLRHTPVATPLERFERDGMDVRHVDDLHVCLSMSRERSLGAASATVEKAWAVSSTTRWWNVVEGLTAKALA